MSVIVETPEGYNWVLYSALAIALECFLIGGVVVMGARKRAFTPEFLNQFEDEHKKAFGGAVAKGGYPDNGNGYYGAKLPYEQWVGIANAQRVHYNCLETLTPALLFLLLGGLGYPTQAAIMGTLMVVGRLLYTIGYVSKGAGGRLIGVIIYEVGFIYSFVLSILTVANVF
eukprot:CAMPEP_0114974062 /NCGR_PEP_ID=MMETSP0216-20121206/1313_1 /TAXON_ID=223996 /ORGANISM="Protocruzia adherens, Strain Boccale" /LENGTH=170 /DNA_ID=CAMNT_0002334647 /DNA_START=40 /DNA_END=552 /DNA_ORIENTATION=-